jgi:hypothetical protein
MLITVLDLCDKHSLNSVISCVEIPCELHTVCMKNGYLRNVRRFWINFQDVTFPHRKTIHPVINNLRQTGLLLDIKRT